MPYESKFEATGKKKEDRRWRKVGLRLGGDWRRASSNRVSAIKSQGFSWHESTMQSHTVPGVSPAGHLTIRCGNVIMIWHFSLFEIIRPFFFFTIASQFYFSINKCALSKSFSLIGLCKEVSGVTNSQTQRRKVFLSEGDWGFSWFTFSLSFLGIIAFLLCSWLFVRWMDTVLVIFVCYPVLIFNWGLIFF